MQVLYNYEDCKYGLLFEDDVIAAYGWYEELKGALEQTEERGDKWFCLKLFTGFRYYDWAIHIPTLINSALFILFWSFLQIFIFHMLQVSVH